MHHVVTEHHPVLAGRTFGGAPEVSGDRVVHALHLAHLIGGEQVVDQFGKEIHQHADADQTAEEQQAGDQHKGPFGTNQAGEVGEDETQQIGAESTAVTVQLLMAAQYLLLQRINEEAAVAAFLRQRQMLAKPAVGFGETGDLRGLLAALKAFKG
ncbi:hypothetical protein D3C81_1533130 [compost metagenome]